MNHSDRAVLALTTVPVDFDAETLARALVEERLAACVSMLPPMTSVYRWQGRIEMAGERQLLIKTARDRLDALQARLHALHPYEVPEWLVLQVDAGSGPYRDWLQAETRLAD